MADLVSPFFLKRILEPLVAGTSTYTGGTLKAMLLAEGTTVPDEIDTAETLDAVVGDVEEYTTSGTGYARLTPGSKAVGTTGMVGYYDTADLVWSTISSVTGNPDPVLICLYVEASGAAADPALTDRYIVAVLDAEFVADGGDFTYVIPSSGLLKIQGVPV